MGMSSLRSRIEKLEQKLITKETPTLNLFFNVTDITELPRIIAKCQEHNLYGLPTIQRAQWVGAPCDEAQAMDCEYAPFKYQRGLHL